MIIKFKIFQIQNCCIQGDFFFHSLTKCNFLCVYINSFDLPPLYVLRFPHFYVRRSDEYTGILKVKFQFLLTQICLFSLEMCYLHILYRVSIYIPQLHFPYLSSKKILSFSFCELICLGLITLLDM